MPAVCMDPDACHESFELRTERRGGVRLVVRGALDLSTVDPFRLAADALVGTASVAIDLEACSELDAAGLGGLLRAVRRVCEAGGRAVIITAAGSPLTPRLRHVGVTRIAPVLTSDGGVAA